MWTLESDGPLFDHKRLWLRPGTAHLFGRVKQPADQCRDSYVLSAKSVSKKHLRISVAAVREGSGSQLHAHTEIIIEDFSKLGTTIDGDKISQTTKVLKGYEHTFQVAKYEHAFKLQWQPIVLTISNLSKAEKTSSDPLASVRKRLEPLDIKFAQEYVVHQTTHVVASKRNVPMGLQGLIFGKYLVSPAYIDAIVKATAEETSPESGEPRAPLEKDFDNAWPDALQYVPDVANEPVPRPAVDLAPKPERTDIFHGYTFVFIQKSQYDALQPVVNAGSGKALLFEGFQPGKSDSRDLVAYVKNVAGEKGVGELDDPDKGRGVVVVRLVTKDNPWNTHFMQETDEQLNQRSFEQNEFLDTIVTNGPSALRKRLAEEVDFRSLAVSTSQPSRVASQTAQHGRLASSSVATKRNRRPMTQSRFKGFDDFDDEPLTPIAPIEEDESMEVEPHQSAHSPPASLGSRAGTQSRKRRITEPGNDHDFMDELLPAAAAMKRRRLDDTGNAAPGASKALAQQQGVTKVKSAKSVDYLEVARKRREEEEEAARYDAERLKEAMDGMEIVGPAHLVDVLEMDITHVTASISARTSRDSSSRWDEKWNGRPNFKKFRKKGEERIQRSHKVIVPLEETRKKDFGIGEDYWLDSSSKQRSSQRDTQPTQTLRSEQHDDQSQFHRRRREPVQVEADDDVQIVTDTLPSTSVPSQHRTRATISPENIRKRPAPEPIKEPPAKRKVNGRAVLDRDDSDEEEDELAFPRSKGRSRRQ